MRKAICHGSEQVTVAVAPTISHATILTQYAICGIIEYQEAKHAVATGQGFPQGIV